MSVGAIPLGSICEFRYGKSLPERERQRGDVPVYGSNGKVGVHREAITSGPTIVIGRKGSFGEVNYSESACWPIDTTYFIDQSATTADLKWLYHLLRTLGLNRLNRAAAVPGLNREDAYSKLVHLPDLHEQRRVAAILDKAEELRAKRRVAIALLDQLPHAIFLEMFGDPTTNPKGWTLTNLGAVADVQGGLQVSSSRRALPLETPYLRVANVYRGCLNLSEIKLIRATESEIARTALATDDLLIVEGHGNPAEIGRAALWDGSINPCAHQNHLIRARFDQSAIIPSFASSYINSMAGRQHLLRAGNTTSGLNTISVSDVKRTPILRPPLEAQNEFASRLAAIQGTKTAHKAALAELDSLFASLQNKAFNGGLN